jgi:23S rRNA (adenine2503-C2)-methyltransferase
MINSTKKDIRQNTLAQLEEFFLSIGEKKFRAKQVYEWIWKHSIVAFDDMTNISLATRTALAEAYEFRPVTVDSKQVSSDGTIKCGFRLFDGNLIEGVLIPVDGRMTACVSSQVGCSLTCKFCATGYMTRKRNLDPAEVYDQVVLIKNLAEQHYNTPLTNIVFMGMGEPLLNYANVLKGIDQITSPSGLNMASKRITVSTAGVAKMIDKLAEDQVKFNLALSLHAADDIKRNEIMPINESNNLNVLAKSLSNFYSKTGNRITLEYIVFDGVNDSIDDAKDLAHFAKKFPCKINIIEYNPIQEAEFKNASVDKLMAFKNYIESQELVVNVRRSRGKDIDAACGQLAIKEK